MITTHAICRTRDHGNRELAQEQFVQFLALRKWDAFPMCPWSQNIRPLGELVLQFCSLIRPGAKAPKIEPKFVAAEAATHKPLKAIPSTHIESPSRTRKLER